MNLVMAGLASPSGELPHVGGLWTTAEWNSCWTMWSRCSRCRCPKERNSLRVSNLLGLGKCLFEEGCGSVEDRKVVRLTDTNRITHLQPQVNPAPRPR